MYVHMYMHTCMLNTCACTRTHVHVYSITTVCGQTGHTCTCISLCVDIHVYVCTCIHVCTTVCDYTCTCMHMYMYYIYTTKYIYMYMYMLAHTCTLYMYMYMYTNVHMWISIIINDKHTRCCITPSLRPFLKSVTINSPPGCL